MILRLLLGALGVVFTAFGVNVGAGGIPSLGLLVPLPFLEVTAPGSYAVQDSHVRCMGGVFTAVGLAYVWGALRGRDAYGLLIVLSGFIAAGGVFRLTGALPPQVIPSFLSEIVLMPLLAFWLWRDRTRH